MVRGRPTRVGREVRACRRAIRSRSQRSTVSAEAPAAEASALSGVSMSTGAGCSGSLPSVVGSSIQRTIVPSE